MAKRMKPVRAWGGFTEEGKLDIGAQAWGAESFYGPAVFYRKSDARFCYTDVRPVIIREAPRKRKKK